MTYFSKALNRLAKKHKVKLPDFSRDSNLFRANNSRLITGNPNTIPHDLYVEILGLFANDKHAQAELVAARCKDACVGPGSEYVEITVKKPGRKSKSATIA